MGDASPGVLRAAFAPPVVRRALTFAVVVGAVLIGINHGDAILRSIPPLPITAT